MGNVDESSAVERMRTLWPKIIAFRALVTSVQFVTMTRPRTVDGMSSSKGELRFRRFRDRLEYENTGTTTMQLRVRDNWVTARVTPYIYRFDGKQFTSILGAESDARQVSDSEDSRRILWNPLPIPDEVFFDEFQNAGKLDFQGLGEVCGSECFCFCLRNIRWRKEAKQWLDMVEKPPSSVYAYWNVNTGILCRVTWVSVNGEEIYKADNEVLELEKVK